MRSSLGLCLFALATFGCGADGRDQSLSLKAPAPTPYIAGLTVTPTSKTIVLGHSVTIAISNGTTPYDCELDPSSSANGSIVVTDPTSTCTYTAPMTVTGIDKIDITDSSSLSATSTITVVAPSITPASPTIAYNATQQLTPAHETAGQGTWTNDNHAVGTVDSSGLFTAIAAGSTTVTFTDTASNATATATITVTPPPLVVNPSNDTVFPRGTDALAITGGTPPYSCAVTTPSTGSPSASVSGTTCNYKAGATGGGTDIVTITDAANVSVSANLTTSAGLTSMPPSASVSAGDTTSFTAQGGDNTDGYTWSFANPATDNNSGATLTPSGASVSYKAGSNTGVDTLTLTDHLGNITTVTVTVGAAIAISGGNETVGPNASFSFQATGGAKNATYTFSLVTNPTAFGSITPAGVYTAPDVVDVGKMDVVQVIDGAGHSATATVTVGPALAITSAPMTIIPGGSIQLGATGGSGTGYSWATTQNTGMSASVSSTGLYHAGHHGGQTDTITLTDSTAANTPHNTAQVTITTTAGINVSAPGSSVVTSGTTSTIVDSIAPKGTLTLTATGGTGAGTYTWAATSTPSGGGVVAVDGSTATYTAGATGSTTASPITDVIAVSDPNGNHIAINITVTQAISVTASNTTPDPNMTVTLTAANGSGMYTNWKITPNGSGATLSATTGATVTYTAGSSSGNDTIIVTDSFGATANVSIGVGHALSVNPATVSVGPLGSISIAPTGGLTPYTFTLDATPNGTLATSGNSATFTANAGTMGATESDTVTITDKNNASVTVSITIAPKFQISPTTAQVAPAGQLQFTLAGGDQSKVTWSVSNNGGSVVNGLYTAGTAGSLIDTVTAVDKNNNTVSAMVTVTPALASSVTPNKVPPRGSATFKGLNGQSPYSYQLISNGSSSTASGGAKASVNASTGSYTAGSNPSTTDKVRITDANNIYVDQTISIGVGVSITQTSPSVAPNGSIAFTASGGAGGSYTWSVSAASGSTGSGGTIGKTTGAYTAGSTGSSTDVVTATDSLGNSASVNVSVGGGIAISPAAQMTAPKGMISFTAAGGSGTGFKWKLSPSASGGSINTTSGVYIAGPTGNVQDTVVVTDSNGNVGKETIAVGASVEISPPAAMVLPGSMLSFAVTGGSGMGYVWSLTTNSSGGSVDQSGSYIAGSTSGADVVTVADSLGNTAIALVSVSQPAPTPPDMGATDMATPEPTDMATPASPDAAVAPVDMGGTTTKKSGGCDVGSGTTSPIALLFGFAFVTLIARRRLARAKARR